MNGAHDLGGMHGFGAIDIDSGEKLFHAEWEKRIFALTLACGFHGAWNIDQSRFAREQMEPGEYLQSSYYEHWLHGLEKLLVEHGLLDADELARGHVETRTASAVTADRIAAILQQGGPADCASESRPKFAAGNAVVIINQHPQGHTRSPRFTRGKHGVVDRYHGSHVLPDISSQPHGTKTGAHLYSVRFEAEALWGAQADGRSAVYVDVFEPYMQAVA